MKDVEALRADLQSLAADFGRLFSTDCECQARTYRNYWPSRYAQPRTTFEPGGPNHHPSATVLMGNGLEVEPLGVRTVDDLEAAAVFYDVAGRPVVNSNGQSLVVKPGWQESNVVYIAGPGNARAAETIERANQLVGRYSGAVLSVVLPPGRCVGLFSRGLPWPSVVNLVAEIAGRSVLKPAEWYVAAGKANYELETWRRLAEFELGGPAVTPELVEAIGTEPENVYADRRAFLRDSELALEWLIDRLAEREPEPESPQQSAMKALIETGLANVVRTASTTRAADQVSAIIRKRWEDDPKLKEWSADRWVIELGCSKPTIVGNKRKGIPPCEAWAERMAWKEANKQARKRGSVS